MFKTTIKPTIILGIVALAASLVLSQIKKITDPHIEKQASEKKDRALRMVLPGFTVDSTTSMKKVTLGKKEFFFWVGEKEIVDETTKQKKKTIGYAFIASQPGYSGDVESMVGVDEKGLLLGISVLKQTETPGLGARCVEIASKNSLLRTITGNTVQEDKNPRPWFEKQFEGLNINEKIKIAKEGDWVLAMKDALLKKNAISAITGATITTTTVRNSIDNGYKKLKKALDMIAKEKSK